MIRAVAAGASLILGLAASGAASAQPWDDERYRSRYGYEGRYGDYDRGYYDRGRRPVAVVPPGHRPPPGTCRVWYDDRPPGHQPPPVSCRRADRIAARDGAVVVTSSGRIRAPHYGGYARYDERRYGYDRYDRVCVSWDRYGNCARTELRRRW